MSQMPESQWHNLELLPAELPVWCLSRHSLREKADQAVAGYDLPLTAAGVALAYQWGERLPRPLSRAVSSPVGRCQETLRAILQAQHNEMHWQTSSNLVEPGAFVVEPQLVLPDFFRMGPLAFANRHLEEHVVPGVLTPMQGVMKLVQHLRAFTPEPGTLSLHITHDTVLAAFIYSLMGVSRISQADWPHMMEGAWIWFEGSTIHWLWRGQKADRELLDGPVLEEPGEGC